MLRFKIAKVVGSAWLRQLDSVPSSLAPTLLSFLAESRLTMIFEILCPDYQHVVDLSYLDQPQLKFLTLTHQYRETGETAHTSLAAFSPDVCIEFARHFGLDTAEYEVMEAGEAEDRMDRVREGQDYEGEVRIIYLLIIILLIINQGTLLHGQGQQHSRSVEEEDDLVHCPQGDQGEGVACLEHLQVQTHGHCPALVLHRILLF